MTYDEENRGKFLGGGIRKEGLRTEHKAYTIYVTATTTEAIRVVALNERAAETKAKRAFWKTRSTLTETRKFGQADLCTFTEVAGIEEVSNG